MGPDHLKDDPWDKLQGDCKGTLLKSLQESKEQAVAGLVSLGSKEQVRICGVCPVGWTPVAIGLHGGFM